MYDFLSSPTVNETTYYFSSAHKNSVPEGCQGAKKSVLVNLGFFRTSYEQL